MVVSLAMAADLSALATQPFDPLEDSQPPPIRDAQASILLGGEVAVWHFEPGDYNSTQDASLDEIHGLPASLGGPGSPETHPTLVPGKDGTAYDFEGLPVDPNTNDYLDAGSPLELRLSRPLSFMAWVYPKVTTKSYMIMSSAQDFGPGFGLGLDGGSRPFAVFGSGTEKLSKHYAPVSIPRGEWTHIAVTMDETSLRIYFNAKRVALLGPAPLIAGSSPLRIGADAGTASAADQRAHAIIDEVRIYNRVVSEREVGRLVGPLRGQLTEVQYGVATPGVARVLTITGRTVGPMYCVTIDGPNPLDTTACSPMNPAGLLPPIGPVSLGPVSSIFVPLPVSPGHLWVRYNWHPGYLVREAFQYENHNVATPISLSASELAADADWLEENGDIVSLDFEFDPAPVGPLDPLPVMLASIPWLGQIVGAERELRFNGGAVLP